jgi:pyridoxal 5'-phosphate synthase pdxT subunit
MMRRVGVLALQGAFAEHVAIVRRLGVQAVEVRLPRDLDGLDGLIIPGGESTTIGKLAVAYGLVEPLRQWAGQRLPIWGTCAGMIMLAKDIGGHDQPLLGLMDVVVRRNAFGRQVDSFCEDLDVPAFGSPPFPGVFIRAPLIERAGPGVEVLASLPGGDIVAARQGHLLATAFHPELTGDPRFHRYFLEFGDGRSGAKDAGPANGER